MKILVLPSLPKDTGSWLRASGFAASMQPYADVELAQPMKRGLPFMLDVLLTLPGNLFRALTTRADFLIGFKPFPNVTIPLLLAKWLRNKKVAVDVDDLEHGFFGPVPALIIKAVQRLTLRFFDMVTTHNPALDDFVATAYHVKRSKIHRLAQGVDTQIFFQRNNAPQKNTLLYVGHLNIASELATILEAVSIVQNKVGVRFLVAGGGPSLSYFKQLAASLNIQANFTGLLPNTAVAEAIAESDICLVYYPEKPVTRYRCSMKLRECLAMGKKVVCNDFDDAKQFSAYIYQSSSGVEPYARKIMEVLESGDARELKGAQHIRERQGWDKIGYDFFKSIDM